MRIFVILLSLLVYWPANAQYTMKCDNVIYPGCSGGGSTGGLILNNNTLKNSPICDTAYIIQGATYGTIEYVGSGGNLEVNDMYNYTTNTNCETEDRFLAVECCADSTGEVVCDTIDYGIHLSFGCQTPPDLFCCIPDNGQPVTFNVLENDAEFIAANYPGFQPLEVFVAGILEQPANGTVVQGPNAGQITYSPAPGFVGVDSVVYDVFYYLENDIDEIRICDEQTVYIIIEDCIQTVTDEVSVAAGDTIYFNALANDYIEPRFEYPVDTLNCQNQLPQIHPASFSLLTQGAELNALGNGNLCFSSHASGCFSYEYEVCSTVGVCATDTIIVKVEACYLEELVIDGDFNDASGSTFYSGLSQKSSCQAQSWCIGVTPKDKCESAQWQSFGAPAGCSPNFLIVDGFISEGIVWSQDVNIDEGTAYEFSFWYYPDLSDGNTPNLNIYLDDMLIGNTSGVSNQWTKYTFNTAPPTTGTMALAIVQANASGFNDYAIDHISFRQLCPWNFCDPVIDLGNNPLYTNVIHAQNEVISANTIPANANISLKAGQIIRIESGFSSNPNANLQLIIEDCIPE